METNKGREIFTKLGVCMAILQYYALFHRSMMLMLLMSKDTGEFWIENQHSFSFYIIT